MQKLMPKHFISLLGSTFHESYLNRIFWITSDFLSIFMKMFIINYESIVFMDQSAFFILVFFINKGIL